MLCALLTLSGSPSPYRDVVHIQMNSEYFGLRGCPLRAVTQGAKATNQHVQFNFTGRYSGSFMKLLSPRGAVHFSTPGSKPFKIDIKHHRQFG